MTEKNCWGHGIGRKKIALEKPTKEKTPKNDYKATPKALASNRGKGQAAVSLVEKANQTRSNA